MFFPEKIQTIKDTDKVLEIGPGSMPYPRADCYLDKEFDEKEAFMQSGGVAPKNTTKPHFYYKEFPFPFKDKEFDYVICSHVIEHVENIDLFIKEMCRVSKRGYLEFPTIYYDYIYNFKVHVSFVLFNEGILYWMPKKHSQLDNFKPVQNFFYKTLETEYYDFIDAYKKYFFQGFEWENSVKTQEVSVLNKLCFPEDIIILDIKKVNTKNISYNHFSIKHYIKTLIGNIKILWDLKLIEKRKEIEFEKSFKKFHNLIDYTKNRFQLNWEDKYPCLNDNTLSTDFDSHYIYHTAWAARILNEIKPQLHVDISSYLYFSTIASAFIPIDFYDYRPANIILDKLTSKHADLTKLHFENDSIYSLSCMHTVEHVGLGRYGDPMDYDGDLKAINELIRVLSKNGNLLFVVPIGKPKIMFNAHRIYSYNQIIEYFSDLKLIKFSLIPDDAIVKGMIDNASSEICNQQNYGCGCFWFKKL